MKIITWNCNGGFRNKLEAIDTLEADILVIQECEDPSQSTEAYKQWAGNQYLWKGESKNKGIGIFAKNGHILQALNWNGSFAITGLASQSSTLNWHTTELRLFLPFKINDEYTALGVWTKGGRDDVFGYMGQFWKFLQIHRQDLSGPKTIITGDFNSNVKWDKPDRWWNHSDVVKELSDMNIKSLYHQSYNQQQGQESHPTFHLHRNIAKPYHIDYFFITSDLIDNSNLVVEQEHWLEISDHLPLVAIIKTNTDT